MICARCKAEIDAGYFGTYSRDPLCPPCYDVQMRQVIQDVSPMGDKESVATPGVTLDKVESAVRDNLK